MRINKRLVSLILICLILSTLLSTELEAATQNENGITATLSEWREITADNASLLAEAKALNEVLASERKATMDLITSTNQWKEASTEEVRLLNKELAASKRRATGTLLLAIGIGIFACLR